MATGTEGRHLRQSCVGDLGGDGGQDRPLGGLGKGRHGRGLADAEVLEQDGAPGKGTARWLVLSQGRGPALGVPGSQAPGRG